MVPFLLRFLQSDMLLLWDRHFLTHATVSAARARQAHLLARITANRVFTPTQHLKNEQMAQETRAPSTQPTKPFEESIVLCH